MTTSGDLSGEAGLIGNLEWSKENDSSGSAAAILAISGFECVRVMSVDFVRGREFTEAGLIGKRELSNKGDSDGFTNNGAISTDLGGG